MKRTPRALAAFVALGLLAGACGGDDAGDATEPFDPDREPALNALADTSSTLLGPEVDADEVTQADDVPEVPDAPELDVADFPRTVEHALGSSEIADAPERIVALAGTADFDALLALGVVPFGAASYYPVNAAGGRSFAPWNQEYVGEVETFVSAFNGLSLEALSALEPDLIVGQVGSVDDAYDQYSAIAPVAVHEYPTDWREPIRIFGDALALEEEAVAAIATIEAEIAAIAERVPDPAPSVALITPLVDQVVVYTRTGGPGPANALTEIGIDVIGTDSPISYERLGDLSDADWIVLFDFTLDPLEPLLDDPLFNTLPAVQAGRVVQLSPEQSFSWAIETSRSIPATLDGILTELGY
ncbi:MAG: ABC transporter substrate-binding protein [Actinomycetota bacterium]